MRQGSDPGGAGVLMVVGPFAALAALAVLTLVRPAWVIEASTTDFIIVTLLIGGATAWVTGRAVARGWGGLSRLLAYCLLLTAAVRFAHFALFEGGIIAPSRYLSELVFITSVACLGYRALRKRQMTERYGWLFRADGPFAWAPRAGPAEE